ncbi:integrase core domain-containing protein [Thermophagus sp. OGC60D27]
MGSLDEAGDVTEQWLDDYNHFPPHDDLGGISPVHMTRK